MKINELYDLSHTQAAAYLSGFTYPWEALKSIKDMILSACVGRRILSSSYSIFSIYVINVFLQLV